MNSMKKSFKRVAIVLLSAVTIVACNKRDDYFASINSEIEVLLSGQDNEWHLSNEYSAVLSDSVKVGKNYIISTQITSTKSIKSVIISKPSIGQISYKGVEISYSESIDINLVDQLVYKSNSIGTVKITIKATDVYDREIEAELHLTVFDNLPPIARLKIIHVDNLDQYEYQFDASESFDQDSEFGGGIVQYLFTIDSLEIMYPDSKMNHIFSQSGNYDISVKCWDNKGAVSNTFTIGNFEVQ